VTSSGDPRTRREGEIPGAGVLGMWIFLATLSMLFLASIAGYLVVRLKPMASRGEQSRDAARNQSRPACREGRRVRQMQEERTRQGGGAKPDVAVARRRQGEHKAADLDHGPDGDERREHPKTNGAVAKPAPLALHDARQEPPKPHPAGGDSQDDRRQRHGAHGEIARRSWPARPKISRN